LWTCRWFSGIVIISRNSLQSADKTRHFDFWSESSQIFMQIRMRISYYFEIQIQPSRFPISFKTLPLLTISQFRYHYCSRPLSVLYLFSHAELSSKTLCVSTGKAFFIMSPFCALRIFAKLWKSCWRQHLSLLKLYKVVNQELWLSSWSSFPNNRYSMRVPKTPKGWMLFWGSRMSRHSGKFEPANAATLVVATHVWPCLPSHGYNSTIFWIVYMFDLARAQQRLWWSISIQLSLSTEPSTTLLEVRGFSRIMSWRDASGSAYSARLNHFQSFPLMIATAFCCWSKQ
jgi:hypothetical protein